MFCFASRDQSVTRDHFVCSGDVFKKETQNIVSLFLSAKKAPKRKTSRKGPKRSPLMIKRKGSYFEQDKSLELDGLVEDQNEAVSVFSASHILY